MTRLVNILVLECSPFRVCASLFQEEKKNLKGEVWRGCLIRVGRIIPYDRVCFGQDDEERAIQLCLVLLRRGRKTCSFFFPFWEMSGRSIYKMLYDLYSTLLSEIFVRNRNYCNLSVLLPDSSFLKSQSFLGTVITKLKIQYMILTIGHLRFTLNDAYVCNLALCWELHLYMQCIIS